MPDILLLPEIATYFDVTVDALMGYEPQLAKEQIQKLYTELGENFVQLPFEDAFAKSEALVKKYYSCYLFLVQICVLWLNHYMLARDKKRQEEILDKIQELCNHILKNCSNTEIYSDVLGIRASVDLICNRPKEIIDGISNLLNPKRVLNQSDGLLIQAYLMDGQMQEADCFTQASMYLHLFMLVGDSIYYLSIHNKEKELCEETITRIDTLIQKYHMVELNPNIVASYHFQVALYRASMGEQAATVQRLQKYAKAVYLLTEKGMLHGDSYFNQLDSWFETLDLGTQMPRNKKIVVQSAKEKMNHPIFIELCGENEIAKLQKMMED